MKPQLYIFIISMLVGCKQPANNKSYIPLDVVSEKTGNIISDSLRDPYNYSYLYDLPTRKIALLMLSDSIRPSDNQITFNCMDSIFSDNVETRNFYFPVFLKIIERADGALSEAAGSYVKKYMEKYPREFVGRAFSMTELQFSRFASFAGYELYFENENVRYARTWTKNLLKKCAGCDTAELNQIERFNKFAMEAVIENNANGN